MDSLPHPVPPGTDRAAVKQPPPVDSATEGYCEPIGRVRETPILRSSATP
ncbi:MAG: hypothetical protein KBA31_12635 [Alphaproteobacteria bacterium]|nr:hypothetical protein [Alphaproteobacteria bacterium]